jgi:hypothetical protein
MAIGYTVTPVFTPDEVKWSASSNPAAAATFGAGASPSPFASADGFLVYLHVRQGAVWVTRSFPARHAPGAFAALSNQSFADNSGPQTYIFPAATGAGLTWTYALTSPPAGVTINSSTRTITFDTNALALQTGTVIAVTATDQYGRVATGSPRTFTLAITGAVNPDFTGLVFADPGDGTPDTLTATFTYAGADTLRAFVVIRSAAQTTALTPVQLRDGTGSFLERIVVNPFSAAAFDLAGFTSASNPGTAIDMAIGELTNGGLSGVQTTAVTGLDFTGPTVVSAEATDANTVVVTVSEAVFGTNAAGNWSFNINGSPATITGVSGSGSTRTLTVSNTMAAGQTLNALAYAPGNLSDGDGNPLAAFSGQGITNSVPGSTWALDEDFASLANGVLQTAGGQWTRIINNGDGAIAGTGTGTVRSPRQSGGSSFPGATNRWDTNIGTEQEVEIDIVAHTGAANTELGVAVRANGTDGFCYQVRHNIGSGAIEVRKGNNWSSPLLGSAFTYSTSAPWTMRVTAQTSGANCVISVFNGATLLNTWTDTTSPYTGQRVGLAALTGGADGTTGARTITAIRARSL